MKKLQLSIPEPCHENWNQMQPDEKGKFCNACQKTVIDFSTMSDRDLVAFFKNSKHSVCGHFQQNQLNRDILISQKRIPWIKYFFQFAIPAFLVSQKSSAQGKILVKDSTVCSPIRAEVVFKEDKIIGQMKMVSGQVKDNLGNSIPGASVWIKNSKQGTAADYKGDFKLQIPPNAILVFSAIGYQTKEIKTGTKDSIQIKMVVLPNLVSGEVLLTGLTIIKKPEKIPLITKLLDSTFSRFSVYPNPVASEEYIQIKFLRQNKGAYQLDFFNSAGALVLTKEIEVENKKETISLNPGRLHPGNYFLRLTENKTGKQFTEKIVVE